MHICAHRVTWTGSINNSSFHASNNSTLLHYCTKMFTIRMGNTVTQTVLPVQHICITNYSIQLTPKVHHCALMHLVTMESPNTRAPQCYIRLHSIHALFLSRAQVYTHTHLIFSVIKKKLWIPSAVYFFSPSCLIARSASKGLCAFCNYSLL